MTISAGPGHVVDRTINGRLTSIPTVLDYVALRYEENRTTETNGDIDWESFLPPGRGFVRLDDDGEKYYAISLYHQIHCLGSLEAAFKSQMNGSVLHIDSHLGHCFGYLLQLALCAADTTLEPSETIVTQRGQVKHLVFGTGAIHQCRDWRQAWHYAAGNYLAWKDKDYYRVVATRH